MYIKLTDNEKRHLEICLENVKYENTGPSSYITELRKIAYNSLPDKLLSLLVAQKSGVQIEPYIIIDNVPIDNNINGTPKLLEPSHLYKSGCVSENVICMFGTVLGEPYSVTFEGHELVNNIIPHPEFNAGYTGLGSEVELDLHIENSALTFLGEHDYSPLGLLLLGLRNQLDIDDGGPFTNIVNANLALAELTSKDIEVLRGNNYLINVPYRWRDTFSNEKNCTPPCPMISGDGYTLRVHAVFYSDMVTCLNDDAQIAFNNFYHKLRKHMISINITPGMLVYVD